MSSPGSEDWEKNKEIHNKLVLKQMESARKGMERKNCSKCPLEEKCKAWKADQIKGAKTQEIGADLEEILENYCLISSYACSMALRAQVVEEV
ncbi:hypothetical protein ES703_15772 [subsurface metagenome]